MVRPRISFGPCLPQNGSWAWIGQDLAAKAREFFDVDYWIHNPPPSDILVCVKFPADGLLVEKIPRSTKIVYFPVDFFVSAEHISMCSRFLRRCDRIIISSSRQRDYFESFAPVSYLDHHVKFAPLQLAEPLSNGPLLWVGVHSNLPPLIEWMERNPPSRRLNVLTNYGDGSSLPPDSRRFLTRNYIHLQEWSPSAYQASLGECSAAIDIKGPDFISCNKPATKAIDFIASGMPLAMNEDASSVEYLRSLGFSIADLADDDRLFSAEYLQETRRMARILREAMSLERVSHRFNGILSDVLRGRDATVENTLPSSSRVAASPGDVAAVHQQEASSSSRDFDGESPKLTSSGDEATAREDVKGQVRAVRVAILSFLFNWPSTGGGIVHTVELASFLQKDGYEVAHFYAQNQDWGVGRVSDPLPHRAIPIPFASNSGKEAIQEGFRSAVREFDPDYVIVTDSWNMKPVLAEAVSDYRYMLRFQALECLCPLNNVRFLPMANGEFRQCGKHQLATPADCQKCVRSLGKFSGGLHQLERDLAGVGSKDYDSMLLRVVQNAYAVLVVNPEMATMFSPYNDNVHVAPSGFDVQRFPWPPTPAIESRDHAKVRLLFAGLVDEWIKGFPYLHQACRDLWEKRQDFELLVTADPIGQIDPFTRHIGWQTQESLPRQIYSSDILIVPTVAQEALGRTAVEAMAAGKPVIASRLGGLKSTVLEGVTGLLAEPGNPASLQTQIERLLDNAELRFRMGMAGRQRFEQEFTWESILDRHYRTLMPQSVRVEAAGCTR